MRGHPHHAYSRSRGALADRIGIIQRGRLVAEGSLDMLRTQAAAGETSEVFLHLTREAGGFTPQSRAA